MKRWLYYYSLWICGALMLVIIGIDNIGSCFHWFSPFGKWILDVLFYISVGLNLGCWYGVAATKFFINQRNSN